jgi:hypothetical protein
MATNCVSVHGTYIALEPSLDGKEPTAFKAVQFNQPCLWDEKTFVALKMSILERLAVVVLTTSESFFCG